MPTEDHPRAGPSAAPAENAASASPEPRPDSCSANCAALLEQFQQWQQLGDLLTEVTAAHRMLQETYCERNVIEPVLQQLIELYIQNRDVTHAIRQLLKRTSKSEHGVIHQGLAQLLAVSKATVQQNLSTLAMFGTQPFMPQGPELNPREHEIVARTHAPTPDDHHQIARTLRPGFRREERVLRKAYVEIYVWHQEETK